MIIYWNGSKWHWLFEAEFSGIHLNLILGILFEEEWHFKWIFISIKNSFILLGCIWLKDVVNEDAYMWERAIKLFNFCSDVDFAHGLSELWAFQFFDWMYFC